MVEFAFEVKLWTLSEVAKNLSKSFTMIMVSSSLFFLVCVYFCTLNGPHAFQASTSVALVTLKWSSLLFCYSSVYKYYLFMSVKNWIVPFHEPVGEWNGLFISHQVDIFQPSHKFKTVNICFISLLQKFQNVMSNLCKLSNDLYHKSTILLHYVVVWSSYLSD